MIAIFKKYLYFPVAWYFRFFAGIRLRRWSPRIVVVTGSNGKTTLLHLLEAQFGSKAKYSHHANSSFGIPFDILGLRRTKLFKSEWIGLFFRAPFRAFLSPFQEKIYIVEADVDRPGEGKFLASFLKPEVVLWISLGRTHGMNFEKLVRQKKFQTVEEAIAFEFGFFLEYCQKLALINGDSPLIVKQTKRLRVDAKIIKKNERFVKYEVDLAGTNFQIDGSRYIFEGLLPEEIFYSIVMCKSVLEYFDLPFDQSFSKLVLPPGRSSIFQGIRGVTIVDSSYNANLSSMNTILLMYDKFLATHKWGVLGDMLEQGEGEQKEHERLAELIGLYDFERIILMGPRVSKYTYPVLIQKSKVKSQNHNSKVKSDNDKREDLVIEKFLGPRETLDYLLANLRGGETILFKGARFMEGIIENLLLDKKDKVKLSRREEVWEKRRKGWGL